MRCEDKAVLDLCRAYCIKRNKTLGEHGRQGPARGEPPSLCQINASLGNDNLNPALSMQFWAMFILINVKSG